VSFYLFESQDHRASHIPDSSSLSFPFCNIFLQLRLSGNLLGAYGARALAPALAKATSLKTVVMRGCGIREAGAMEIAAVTIPVANHLEPRLALLEGKHQSSGGLLMNFCIQSMGCPAGGVRFVDERHRMARHGDREQSGGALPA
jgi:hypothetical protein